MSYKRHAAAIAAFNKEFVRAGLFAAEDYAAIKNAFDLRHGPSGRAISARGTAARVGFVDGELILNKSKTKRAKVKSKKEEPEKEEDVTEGGVVKGEVFDWTRPRS